MDLTRELRNVVGSGKIAFGIRQAEQAIKDEEAKLVIVARNCPRADRFDSFKRVYHFEGTNVELGAACGKPFSVAALTVLEAGDSAILDLV